MVGGVRVSRVEPVEGLLHALAADEPHGVVRAAVGVATQAVNGDDSRVFEVAGHLGLDQEPEPALVMVGVLALDLLEGDLAVQLLVAGDEHLPQPSLGVESQDAIAQARNVRVGRMSRPRRRGLARRFQVNRRFRAGIGPVGRGHLGLIGLRLRFRFRGGLGHCRVQVLRRDCRGRLTAVDDMRGRSRAALDVGDRILARVGPGVRLPLGGFRAEGIERHVLGEELPQLDPDRSGRGKCEAGVPPVRPEGGGDLRLKRGELIGAEQPAVDQGPGQRPVARRLPGRERTVQAVAGDEAQPQRGDAVKQLTIIVDLAHGLAAPGRVGPGFGSIQFSSVQARPMPQFTSLHFISNQKTRPFDLIDFPVSRQPAGRVGREGGGAVMKEGLAISVRQCSRPWDRCRSRPACRWQTCRSSHRRFRASVSIGRGCWNVSRAAVLGENAR